MSYTGFVRGWPGGLQTARSEADRPIRADPSPPVGRSGPLKLGTHRMPAHRAGNLAGQVEFINLDGSARWLGPLIGGHYRPALHPHRRRSMVRRKLDPRWLRRAARPMRCSSK